LSNDSFGAVGLGRHGVIPAHHAAVLDKRER